MSKLIIFGAGDIARLAHYYFSHDSEHEVVAFTVDRAYRGAESFENLPLVDFETIAETFPPPDYAMFIAVSYAKMNRVRADKYARAKELGYTLVSYVSSHCTFLSDLPVGDNCFILEDNTIQPFVKIGNDVTLWSGNHIGHDSVIGNHVFVAPRVAISGNVRIGDYSFIGINATLRNSISIAPRTLVGAGAVILEDTTERGVYLPHRAMLAHKTSDEVSP